MSLACKIVGHKWNGCACSRCGERRDEGHEWDGCTCSCCGKHRDEGHQWDACVCTRCGERRDIGHRFNLGRGDCVYACDMCGKTRVRHDWDGCVCRTCGEHRDSGHSWELREDAEPIASGHLAVCKKCGRFSSVPHSFGKPEGCLHKCWKCGYEEPRHTFANGVCRGCGRSERDYLCGLIASSEGVDYRYVKRVPTLAQRAVALGYGKQGPDREVEELVLSLKALEGPNPEGVYDAFAAVAKVLSQRQREGFQPEFNGQYRLWDALDAVGRAACRSDEDLAKAAAIAFSCATDYAELPSEDEIGRHAETMKRLKGKLPDDPDGQRAFINAMEDAKRSLGHSGIACFTGYQGTKELLDCCMLIESLRPYAYDVLVTLNSVMLYRSHWVRLAARPEPTLESLISHAKDCKRWRTAARRIIALSSERPDVLYPVWDRLDAAINGAKAYVFVSQEVGKKQVQRRLSPDAPDDWTETATAPAFEKADLETPMKLHFPGK